MAAAAPQPGTAMTKRDAAQALVESIRDERFAQQIKDLLPATVTVEKFKRTAGLAILNNDKLVDCDRASLFQALLRCAQDGLLPDGREAAIVPYKGKASYVPMIGGLRKSVGEFGWQLSASVVFANDHFEYEEGTTTILRHRPCDGDRGEMIAAYATARHIGGGVAEPVVMWKPDILKRKAKAQTENVWNEWPERMWEKTPAKALAKELPLVSLDPRIQRILAADDLDYIDSRAQLYGPTTTPAIGSGDAAPAMEGNGGQQVDPAADPDPGSSAADQPAPGDDDEPPPPLPAADQNSEERERAEAAGQVVAPKTARDWAGQSIEQIAATGEPGEAFLKWALDGKRAWAKDTHADHVFYVAVCEYVAVFHPDLVEAS